MNMRRKLGNDAATLLLRIDADHRVGLGHAVRCSALIAELCRDLEIVVAGDDLEILAPYFPTARFWSVARYGLERILQTERPDVVIADLPKHTPEFWRTLRSSSRLVVAIDDEGGAIAADLVINGAAPEACHRYPILPPGGLALTGPAYTLLRRPFRSAKWFDLDEPSVSIVVGSGERAKDWAFSLVGDTLDRSTWGNIRMVVGRAFSDLDGLFRACELRGVELLCGLDAERMADVLARSRVALITGGMIMSEALAIGAPAVAFPQVRNLEPETAWFAERGAVRNLGYDGGMDVALIGAEVETLLENRSLARGQSARGRAIVDGRGTDRAVAAIRNLMS